MTASLFHVTNLTPGSGSDNLPTPAVVHVINLTPPPGVPATLAVGDIATITKKKPKSFSGAMRWGSAR
jgi:hypothetical protein